MNKALNKKFFLKLTTLATFMWLVGFQVQAENRCEEVFRRELSQVSSTSHSKPHFVRRLIEKYKTYKLEQHLKLPRSEQVLLAWLEGENKNLSLDIDPKDMNNGLLNLRNLILNTDSQEFSIIFSQLTKKNIAHLMSLLNEGHLKKMSPLLELRLRALNDFIINDMHNALFNTEAGAWNSLLTHHPDFRGPGHMNHLGNVIGRLDTYTITRLDTEVWAAVNKKHSRVGRGRWWQRSWVHPYFKGRRIQMFTNQIRLRLEYLEQIEQALLKEVEEEQSVIGRKFNTQEMRQINEALRLVEEMRELIKVDVVKAFGQDLFVGGLIVIPKDIDIYVIDEKIRRGNLIQSDTQPDFALKAEKVTGIMDSVFNSARKSVNAEERTEKDMDVGELRVRHRKYKVESALTDDHWQNETMQKGTHFSIRINYSYTYRWTTTKSVPDGKGGTTTEIEHHSETRYDNTTINPTYLELFYSELSEYRVGKTMTLGGHSDATIERISGKNEALEETMAIRIVEEPFYKISTYVDKLAKKIKEHDLMLSESKLNNEKLLSVKQDVENDLGDINTQIKKLKKHLGLSDSEIKSLWNAEDVEYFRVRNQELLEGLSQLKELYESYLELLLRKEYELEVEADLPDFSKEQRQAGFRASVYYGTMTTLSVSSLAGSYKIYSDYQMQMQILDWLNQIKNLGAF